MHACMCMHVCVSVCLCVYPVHIRIVIVHIYLQRRYGAAWCGMVWYGMVCTMCMCGCACVYVCVYVCNMYVCMYVCMYVRMHVWIGAHTHTCVYSIYIESTQTHVCYFRAASHVCAYTHTLRALSKRRCKCVCH